ncbi:hypothetical protein SDC9_172799 [bioreactor metagenome]|uniref:Uncharacterized protein n=1 Tax=bioreactor metagenome TaxID=1076179 RepID=A0A645GGX0_9ZZZZ
MDSDPYIIKPEFLKIRLCLFHLAHIRISQPGSIRESGGQARRRRLLRYGDPIFFRKQPDLFLGNAGIRQRTDDPQFSYRADARAVGLKVIRIGPF